jgi:hypothetical protein
VFAYLFKIKIANYNALEMNEKLEQNELFISQQSETYFQKNMSLAWFEVLRSAYVKANILYIIYSVGMICINYLDWSLDVQNLNYLIFGLVHLANAVMYLWVWVDSGRDIFTWFVLADWLNVLGALLYLTTAIMYPMEYTSDDDGADYTIVFYVVRYLELLASLIEVIAAFGWNYQWYAVYIVEYRQNPLSTRGRGFTLDDPDLWANFTITIGAIIYLYYNVSLFADNFDNYDTNYSFTTGDLFYFANSIFYFIASLRDCNLFWFMPLSGVWPSWNGPECQQAVTTENSSPH